MMLHEAVMLEIYRQALSASELTSPRCQSRESNTSATAGNARCPSNESHCSANDCLTPAPTPTPNSPVGLPLQATLAPTTATALLPPQSAAMAAYLNAAAAAAQQNHLLLTNPLAAAASLVQQAATQVHSPTSNATPPNGSEQPEDEEEVAQPALDFSRTSLTTLNNATDEEDDDEADEEHASTKMGASAAAVEVDGDEEPNAAPEDGNAPLDLTVTTRKRLPSRDEDLPLRPRKLPRPDYKTPATPAAPSTMQPGTWVPPLNPYLAAVAAASLSPKTHMSLGLDWNGNAAKAKTSTSSSSSSTTNEATKALEKMTEMSRLGAGTTDAGVTTSTITNGRHSAWQSHWLNKGADAAKDVFKCVWCKQSFPSLATLTTHMKETQHCGVNMPPTGGGLNLPAASMTINQSGSNGNRHVTNQSNSTSSSGTGSTMTSNSSTAVSNKAELNMLIKETMPLPRKLVRGQDVWLGKGAEQTRQILKCMWCGQSFRSLAEMTNHMQETQHYTNIISQEQIISWKSTDEKGGSGDTRSAQASNGSNSNQATTPPAAGLSHNVVTSNVNAVLTCKVCEQAFATLKELSQHMVKHNHYKEHMLRTSVSQHCDAGSIGSPQPPPPTTKRGRQPREKRKKSLPVRKLLELERAQHDFKSSSGNCLDSALKPLRDFAAATKITCEKCGSKIETALFVEHIRKCLGDSIPIPPRKPQRIDPLVEQQRLPSPRTPSSLSGSSNADHCLGLHSPMLHCAAPASVAKDEKPSSTPSVLNALEQLIEKSFETRTRHHASGSTTASYGESMHGTSPLGSSILKRLGIDDSSDYTKPLMDVQTMNFLRSYSAYSSTLRDRSASESSSMSERCNSRIESYTPERSTMTSTTVEHVRQATTRLTPERMHMSTPATVHEKQMAVDAINIKSEPQDADESSGGGGGGADAPETTSAASASQKISVKKEFCMPEVESENPEETHTPRPGSSAISPSNSDRSLTPKSTTSSEKKVAGVGAGSSLIALSSMFDNLNNMNSNAHIYQETNNSNNNNAMSTTTAKKSNANPLAALQKLCDTTTEATTTTPSLAASINTLRSSVNTSSSSGANAGGGSSSSMVAFSWACNDGVMTGDSVIKCAFCDTPFCSKGAYRHHLSKVHFVKEDPSSASSSGTATAAAPSGSGSSSGDPHSPKSLHASSSISPKRSASRSPATQHPQHQPLSRHQSISPSAASSHTPTINPYDESTQSKFLKYTELAKQLSSKNA